MFGGVGVSGKRSRIFGLFTRDMVEMADDVCVLDRGELRATLDAGSILPEDCIGCAVPAMFVGIDTGRI